MFPTSETGSTNHCNSFFSKVFSDSSFPFGGCQCACMALDAGTWLQRVMCICESYGLSKPVGEEQLPVGNGSNPVKFLLFPDNCCFFVLFQI